MIDKYNILLDTRRNEKEISVKADISFKEKICDVSLVLNKGLIIDKIIDEKGNNIAFNEELNANVMFIESSKRVFLEIPHGTSSITVEYCGSVSGWHNSISDNLIALNYYSAWYPICEKYDMSINKKVIIKNNSDFKVIKSKKVGEGWIYNSRDFDCNILAVKDWNQISLDSINPKLNIFFQGNETDDIKHLANSFNEIISYFTEILEVDKNILETFDIVISKVDGGGYCRKGLIVLCDLPKEKINLDAFIAHECGHIWAVGADVNTWEDWLNETFAEVLSLWFIKKKYGLDGYNQRISRIKEVAEKSPQIKTEDGIRTDGVHFKGTYLMHKLSEKFGEDTVIKIVKLFVREKNKNTENDEENIVIGTHGTALSTIINYYDRSFNYLSFEKTRNIMPWIVYAEFEGIELMALSDVRSL